MLTYETRAGDVVDDIAFRHYGLEHPEVLRAVFEANPGLADRGAILPAGVRVILPDVAKPVGTLQAVSLWD